MSETQQIKVSYGPLRQVPFPDGIEPESMPDGCGMYIVRTAKLFGRKWGAMDTSGRLVVPVECKEASSIDVIGGQWLLVASAAGSGPRWLVFDLNGQQLSGGPWVSVVDLGHQMLGLQGQSGWALADATARPLTEFCYKSIQPYCDDRLVAQAEDRFDVFDKAGTRTGSLRSIGGVPLVSFEYVGYQLYRYATDQSQMTAHTQGLFDELGGIVIPAGSRAYLEPVNQDRIRFGHMEVRQISRNDGVKTVTTIKSRLIWGLLDRDGNVAVPEIFAEVGPSAEGLRACIQCDSEWATFGYIDDAWHLAIVVARDSHKATAGDAFKYGKIEGVTFLEPIDTLMSPFVNGLATVRVKQVTDRVAQAAAARLIDHQGNTVAMVPAAVPTGGAADDFVPPLPPNFEADTSPFERRSVGRVAGDAWIAITMANKEKAILSQFETTRGFFCGLLQVVDRTTKKTGFVDPTGTVVIPPIYDQAKRFRDNRTWARIGKQYYALSRDMTVSVS